MNLIKKIIKQWIREDVMEDYWTLIDSILSPKRHGKMLQFVNGRYYEIIRRYKARARK